MSFKKTFLKFEVPDQLAECNIVVLLVPRASFLVVAVDLQLCGEKRPVFIAVSYIVLFMKRTKVSLEAPLYGLTVVKNNAVSDDQDILISNYSIDVYWT